MKAHSGAVGCVEQSCAILPRVGVPPTSTSVVNPPSENPTCLCAFRLTGHEMPILQAYIREQAALVEVDRSDLCDSPHNSGPCSCRPCVSGHHYKTSLDQRKSSVIVTGQRTSCTVRYQNKRQSIPRNLTVDRHSLAERPKRLRGCLPNARIPDTNRKWLTFGVRHRYLLEADGTSGRLGKHEHDYSGDRPYFHRVQPIILTLSPS